MDSYGLANSYDSTVMDMSASSAQTRTGARDLPEPLWSYRIKLQMRAPTSSQATCFWVISAKHSQFRKAFVFWKAK